jgi:hypothetical protein
MQNVNAEPTIANNVNAGYAAIITNNTSNNNKKMCKNNNDITT